MIVFDRFSLYQETELAIQNNKEVFEIDPKLLKLILQHHHDEIEKVSYLEGLLLRKED